MQPETIKTAACHLCYLCGREGVELYRDAVDPFFGAPGTWTVKRCPEPSCGLIWLDPMPLAEDLHLAYRQYFTHAPEASQKRGADIRAALYFLYKTVAVLPASLTGLRRAQVRLDGMFLDEQKPGKLLDVGCGDGKFLDRMKTRGWEPYGVDLDTKAIAHAKAKYGLDLLCGDLEGARFPTNHFQAVTLNQVIEHIPDPVRLLKEACRVTGPGGRVVVTTPCTSGRGHQTYGKFWFGLDAPRHLHLFNPRNLSEAANRAGLTVERSGTTAARADIFLGASESIRSAPGNQAKAQPPPNLARTLRAVCGQYREHFALRRHPDCGEEAYIIAVKH